MIDIAAEPGVHPNTVSRALRRGGEPPAPPRRRASKLDPFRAQIDELLARGIWNAEVIFRRIQPAGYPGGRTVLRLYIQPSGPCAHPAPLCRSWMAPLERSPTTANELRLQGVDVSPSGVRGVWLRHDLATCYNRLMPLEAAAQEQTHVLTDDQVRVLEPHSPEFRMRQVETSAPGELLN